MLFHGSFNCLDVLLLVRPLQSTELHGHLHHTGDMNVYSSSSVITFIVQTVTRPTHRSHHTIILSPSTFYPFEQVFLTQKGFFEHTEILVLTKTTIQF